jgi:chromosome segregation ATPase
LESQLEDTRRDVENLVQARQEEKWQDDPQLQQLRENLDSAQHRYNANVGEGNKDPRVLDPLQKEVDNWLTLIKARQQQIGVDPGEIKVEEGLNNLIQSLRNKLQSEKQLVGQVLDPLEKQLSELDPVVAGLPEAEQDLAHQLRRRLDALNEARQKYAQAVGEGAVAPSAKVTELQKQIAELKDRAERRERDLAQQSLRSRDAELAQDIAKAKSSLDADQKPLVAARNAYGQLLLVFEEKQAGHDAAEAAQQKKINLLDAQRAAYTELESARRDRDEKQSAAEHAFGIQPITDADVIAAAPADPRMSYSLFVLGAGVVVLAGLTFVSHSAAHRAHHSAASAYPHEPPKIAQQLDSLVLPVASPPRSDA